MWQYNKTDDMYVGRFDDNKSLMHHGIKGMKWKHKKGITTTSSNTNLGNGIYQNVKRINSNGQTVVQAVKGRDREGTKYVSLDVGKPKDDWTYDDYKEKKIKIGRSTININNELGCKNIRIDTKSKNKASKGKSILSKLFSKKK